MIVDHLYLAFFVFSSLAGPQEVYDIGVWYAWPWKIALFPWFRTKTNYYKNFSISKTVCARITIDIACVVMESVQNQLDKSQKLIKDSGGRSIDATVYMQIIGNLMYLIATQLDINHVVSLVSWYMDRTKDSIAWCEENPKVCKRNFRLWLVLQYGREARFDWLRK